MALIDKIVAALSSKEDIEAAKKLNAMSDDELKIMMKALEYSKIKGISFEDALQKMIDASKALGEGLDSRLDHPTRQQVGVRGPQRGNDKGKMGSHLRGNDREESGNDKGERDDNKHN